MGEYIGAVLHGLGWGIALIFDNHLRKYDDVRLGSSVFTAVEKRTSGCDYLPRVPHFAYGIELTAGTSLTFIALVNVLSQLPSGRIWATAFFVDFFLRRSAQASV